MCIFGGKFSISQWKKMHFFNFDKFIESWMNFHIFSNNNRSLVRISFGIIISLLWFILEVGHLWSAIFLSNWDIFNAFINNLRRLTKLTKLFESNSAHGTKLSLIRFRSLSLTSQIFLAFSWALSNLKQFLKFCFLPLAAAY